MNYNRSLSVTFCTCTVLLMTTNPPPYVAMEIFGYVVAYSFTYIMVSVAFLRNVPIIFTLKYLLTNLWYSTP